jgi:predicted tellurium resistance membrane protein TerC
MSLDNMIAVGGAAHGHLGLLLFGLALSIPILLVGSSVISHYITKYPWLNYVGAAILIHTALEMFFADDFVHDRIQLSRVAELAIIAVAVTLVVLYGAVSNRRAARAESQPVADPPPARTLPPATRSEALDD